MKLAVSYDDEGRIRTLFDPEKMRGQNGSFTYVPAKGEKHVQLELPKEMEHMPILELAHSLRVNAKGGHPKFEAR